MKRQGELTRSGKRRSPGGRLLSILLAVCMMITMLPVTVLAGDGPEISVLDTTVHEDAGSATFTISLSQTYGSNITVNYTTYNNTAIAPIDYQSAWGTVTIEAENTFATVTVPIYNDTIDEENKSFYLNISDQSAGEITKSQGECSITDDDDPPTVSISDATVTEGDSGTVNSAFNVTLSSASGKVVTVNYATQDGTATVADIDYIFQEGTLTFVQGETSKTITITVKADTTPEEDETFLVNLTSPVNVSISDDQGSGTITNDDTASPSTLSLDLAEGNITIADGTNDDTLEVTYGGGSSDNIDPSTTITITQTNAATASTSYKIVISANVTDGVKIKLNGINIEGISASPLKIDTNAGKVNLILADGTFNTLTGGNTCAGLMKDNTAKEVDGLLTISCETAGSADHECNDTTCGKLIATGGRYAAGIGGGNGGAGSYITISGGNVTAAGGSSWGGAGIGGGKNGAGSYITISGGKVIATGGSNGAGIGGGENGTGSHIIISGGNVTATGGSNCAGIGGSSKKNGSDITISGGIVSATGNSGGAGIGGGGGAYGSVTYLGGSGSNITISGGTVTAKSTQNGHGIGAGGYSDFKGDSSNIKITGGNVYASSIGTAPQNDSAETLYKATFSIPDDTTGGTTLDAINFNINNTSYTYGMNDTRSILNEDEGKLFVYLPLGTYSTVYGGNTYTAVVNNSGNAEFVLPPTITAFNFNGLTPNVTGTVDEVNKTISLTVPYGTDVTALVPTITHTGVSLSPNTGVAQDFTTPVTYTVTAADSLAQEYTVTVSVYGADVNVKMNHSGHTSETTNSLYLNFQITNSSTTPINLSDVKIRYYYTLDGDEQQNFFCDSASIETASGAYTGIIGNVTGTFVNMSTAATDADYYLEIGFTAGTLTPGEYALIQSRVTKSGWINYNQSNDYSFNSSATQFVESDKIVMLIGDNIVSGVPPTAPRLTAGAITRTSDTTGTVKFTSDKTGVYYYKVVSDGAAAPTINTSGTGITCDITETTITNPTGLNAGAKDIYIVVKDAAGDISIPIKLDIPAYVVLDTTSPTITSGSCAVAADNTYIDIMFSEGVYGEADGATALTAGKLALTFTQNGGTATNAVISSVKNTDSTSEGSASALTGGENTVRVFLTVTGSPNGLETIEIKPANSTSIYDLTGNAMLAEQTSGVKSLMDLVVPIATVQSITGTLQVGATLTGHYTYSDVHAEGTSIFKWYRSDTAAGANNVPIAGATSLTYVLQTADIGKYISFEVTPVAAVGTAQGSSVESALVGPIVAAGGGGGGGGGGSGNSTPVPPPAPVITISEVKSELFENTEDIKVEADVTSAFGQSVEVKITDSTESEKEVFSLAGSDDKVYPFDISLYSKESNQKVQPKDGYSVKITIPIPQKLLEDREQIKVVYGKDGKLETLKSELFEKDGKWYIIFEATHFSPYALIVSAKPSVSWTNPFSDVKEGDWYYSAVQYVAQNGLMFGTGSNTFSPQLTTNRGMIATILYRLSGSSETLQSTFKDVIPGAYYANAVAWAQEKGIIAGYGNGMFGPEDSITREQMAAILWRYAGSPVAADSKGLAGFMDANEISLYAKDALAWIYEKGIMAGKGNGIHDPKGYVSRAEVATIIINYLNTTKK